MDKLNRRYNSIKRIPHATSKQEAVLLDIRRKGNYEQERQYLFPSLAGNKALTRNTIGKWATFDRQYKRGKYPPLYS